MSALASTLTTKAETPAFWATQSRVTDPGTDAAVLAALDALPDAAADSRALQTAASQLVLHYRAQASHVRPDRRAEIHTRTAAVALARLVARNPSLAAARPPDARTVGCCRDAALLLVAAARHKGIPARVRVGFAAYFVPGLMLDHAVAELWDAAEGRWRRVDAERAPGDDTASGVDWFDLSPRDFQAGPEAWAAARRGAVDPAVYVVAPKIELPGLRGWPYLAHNVVHDLASLDKKEMLLWDDWGIMSAHFDGTVPDADAALLDEVCSVLLQPGFGAAAVRALMSRAGLAVPRRVTRYDPYGGPPVEEDVSQLVA
ncbi:transglutaminase [Zopfochytrium polystomum]|nr:transglutaminase [Zopfochytrium polystomum]